MVVSATMKASRLAALSCGAALAALGMAGTAGCPPSLDDPQAFQTSCPTGFSVEAFFLAQCTRSGCHGNGPAAAGGLDLASADAFDRMYGVSSAACGQPLVAPGGPGQSLLVAKLEGTSACGGRMPLGGPYLSTAEMACVTAWISAAIAKAGPPPPPDAGGDAGVDAPSTADAGDAGDDAASAGDAGDAGLTDADAAG